MRRREEMRRRQGSRVKQGMRRKGVQRLREVLMPKSAEREYKEVSNVSFVI